MAVVNKKITGLFIILAFSVLFLMCTTGCSKPPVQELDDASQALAAAKSACAPEYAPVLSPHQA